MRWAWTRRRWPRFPRSSSRAWWRARRCSATPARTIPTTGWADWPARTCTPSSSCSRATPRSASAAQAEHEKLRRALRGRRSALVARSRGHAAVRLRARPLRLPRPAVAAGHRRIGRRADARLGRAAQGGRVHPRLPGRRRPAASLPQPEILSRNGSYMAYRRLEEHVGEFRDFLRAARRDARGAGTDRRQADGPLAQRRAARARAGQGRSGARRRPAAQQRLQLQADGPARLCGAARLAHPADESARHGREHEPAPDDPPRRAPTGRLCRKARRTTAWSAASRRS